MSSQVLDRELQPETTSPEMTAGLPLTIASPPERHRLEPVGVAIVLGLCATALGWWLAHPGLPPLALAPVQITLATAALGLYRYTGRATSPDVRSSAKRALDVLGSVRGADGHLAVARRCRCPRQDG